MSDIALFDSLGFHWDRAPARRPVDLPSVSEVLADFDRGLAHHVWAAAVIVSGEALTSCRTLSPGGTNLRALHARGHSALEQCAVPFEKASACCR